MHACVAIKYRVDIQMIIWSATYILDLMSYSFSVRSRMATGYDAQGNEAFFYDLGWVAPAGQMYSTVNDLMKVHNYS